MLDEYRSTIIDLQISIYNDRVPRGNGSFLMTWKDGMDVAVASVQLANQTTPFFPTFRCVPLNDHSLQGELRSVMHPLSSYKDFWGESHPIRPLTQNDGRTSEPKRKYHWQMSKSTALHRRLRVGGQGMKTLRGEWVGTSVGFSAAPRPTLAMNFGLAPLALAALAGKQSSRSHPIKH